MPVKFQRSQIILAILLATFVLGLALSAYDFLEYNEGLASKDWVPAKGKILTNSIRTDRTLMSKLIFIPSASYSYHINADEALRGDRVSFPDHVAAPEKDLKALLKRLQIGQEVTSYYDPKNHARVTMERGVRHSRYCLLFVRDAAISLLGGLLALTTWLRLRKK